ncbi:MAG: RagB/SusD family nutrient uptake outer membrane protein, partial [Tannerella sp.]|nr:RagB/SusD family nutrient uptake outer membrane protein [Tannerella sp.]
MNKIIGKFLSFLLFAFLLLPSCSDWLDLKPYDGVTENDYWNTKEDVYSALIGCYSSLLNPSLVTNMIYWGELRADILTGSSSAGSDQMNVIRGEITPENGIVKWAQFYTTINYCNKLIEKSALVRNRDLTFSDALYQQYKAEATAIRSLMYFYLVRSFSDVPFVTKASDNDQQDYQIAKTAGSAILDSLALQMNNVINYLPVNLGNNDANKGRITRWTGLSLLADIYLWQENYAGCNELCTQVINSGQFTLIPVQREIFYVLDMIGDTIDMVYHFNQTDANILFDRLYVTGNSVESIFELQFPKTHETLTDPFFPLFNNNGRPQLAPQTADIYESTIFPIYEDDSEVEDVRSRNFSFSSGYVWKWVGTSRMGMQRTQRQFPHWIIYRLPDILLMKAEALTQTGIRDNDRNA